MKVLLIISHHCILPGAFKGFEEILDRLHHEKPGMRVTSTSLTDLENDLTVILREGVESVSILPYLLLNGQHSRNDIPHMVSRLQAEYPNVPITLLPCIGDWSCFADMIVAGVSSIMEKQNKTACEVKKKGTCSLEKSHESTPQKNKLFAVEMNLETRNVLVVGGGTIALRKVKTLVPTGANITVVAPQILPEFNALAEKHSNVTLVERSYERQYLRGIFMVFICTDHPSVNAQVNNDAHSCRILVNNACDYKDGDFIVPARLDFGENITVTVSTQGQAPALAKKLKNKIQDDWGNDLVSLESDYLTNNY